MAATLGAPPADVPARAFPFRITVEDCGEDAGAVAALLADGAATVVRLPLRETRTTEEIAAHVLDTIHPDALIFLPFINELVLDLAGRPESWRRTTGGAVVAGRLMHLTRDAGRSRQSWLVARSTIRVGRAAIEALEDPSGRDCANSKPRSRCRGTAGRTRHAGRSGSTSTSRPTTCWAGRCCSTATSTSTQAAATSRRSGPAA